MIESRLHSGHRGAIGDQLTINIYINVAVRYSFSNIDMHLDGVELPRPPEWDERLPLGWKERLDSSGKKYYVDQDDRTTWRASREIDHLSDSSWVSSRRNASPPTLQDPESSYRQVPLRMAASPPENRINTPVIASLIEYERNKSKEQSLAPIQDAVQNTGQEDSSPAFYKRLPEKERIKFKEHSPTPDQHTSKTTAPVILNHANWALLGKDEPTIASKENQQKTEKMVLPNGSPNVPTDYLQYSGLGDWTTSTAKAYEARGSSPFNSAASGAVIATNPRNDSDYVPWNSTPQSFEKLASTSRAPVLTASLSDRGTSPLPPSTPSLNESLDKSGISSPEKFDPELESRSTSESVDGVIAECISSLTDQNPLTERQSQRIRELLEKCGKPSWSRIPRIYTVLRLTNQLHFIDDFVMAGIGDLWLPFTDRSLPDTMKSIHARTNFLTLQKLVLSKALDLEKGELGSHKHFKDSSDLPFRSLKILGKGGFGIVDKVESSVSYRTYARKYDSLDLPILQSSKSMLTRMWV